MHLIRRKNQFAPLFDLVFGDDFKNSIHHGFSHADHITQDEDMFTLSIELPGYLKDDFQIEVKDHQLFVSADFDDKSDNNDRYRRSFKKVYNIDINHIDIDKIDATYESGILKIRLPKVEILTKKIAISVN